MNKNKIRIAGIVAIILGLIVTASGILVSISESNTIGFTEGYDDDDQVIIPDPDDSGNWIAVIIDLEDGVIGSDIPTTDPVTTYTPPTITPTDPVTTPPTPPPEIVIDTIDFDSLVFELIDEFTIECRYGFLYNQHDIKEATISFSKSGNQLLDENNDPVLLTCDKIGIRAFRTEFDWWAFPEGSIDVDVTILFDVYIDGVQIPDLEDTIGYYDDKGTLTIPDHEGEKPADIIEEYHYEQGTGKWLIITGILIAAVGTFATILVTRKKK